MEVAASFNATAILLSHAAGNVPITLLLIFRLHFRRLFYFHRARLYIVLFVFFQIIEHRTILNAMLLPVASL